MKNKLYTALFILGISLSSCEKMLEVKPRQSIEAETALTNPAAITAATNSVYARLREVSLYGRDLIVIPEVLADNSFNTQAGNRLISQWNNQPGAHMSNWQYSYYAINQINLILDAIENISLEEDYKKKIKGQNLFLRALMYHNLLRVYAYDPTADIPSRNFGGVPILLKGVTKTEEITFPERNTVEEGYQLIYKDLTEAYELLATENKARAPFFATAAAVSALFSRVALYNGDYEKVISESNRAMQSGIATFPSSAQYIASWRSEKNPESFFEVAFAAPDNLGSNESLRATLMSRTTISSQTAASFGYIVLSDELYDLYADGDLRKDLIMKGLGTLNASKNEITKFASKNGIVNLDNVPVIRYAEMILNKAEAHAKLGQTDLANIELNKIRTRVNLPAVHFSAADLMAEILLQRRLELAYEGHRFFDLKRLGIDIVKEQGLVEFTDYRFLARLPIREVTANPNLKQNFGY